MAYSSSKYQLTQLLQDAWFRMGQLKVWKATGGSATTVVNSAWAGVEEQIYEDDDAALIYGTVVVVDDTVGAAPEGEMGRITDYDSSAQTITMDTLTASVAVGDRIGIASPLFPLQDMIEAVNVALQKLGDIDIPDTSIVIAAGQTEYSLPTAIRQVPLRVRYQTVQDSDNNQWYTLPNPDIRPATVGSNWTITLPQLPVGHTVEILYRAKHPKITSFDSNIIETVDPELALCAVLAEAYQWYNNQVGGSNAYMLQRENKAIQDLEAAKILYPLNHVVKTVTGMPHWTGRNRYIPLTSDLRE